MTETILALNIGSSSIKYALYDTLETEGSNPLQKTEGGQISRLGLIPVFKSDKETVIHELTNGMDHKAALEWMIDHLNLKSEEKNIVAVGHRVVHGGIDYKEPQIISQPIIEKLEELSPLAPTHQPFNLMGIRTISELWPQLPQVACFDTSFHRTAPRLAQLYALPNEFADEGIVRFGFHGLSYEYIASILPTFLGDNARGKVIVLHLGHGCSMCALSNLKSQDTTMGFSALGGLMMGKRCGDIDPGVLLHLMREKDYSVDELEKLLSKQSGLLGVSGVSDDMRDLLASETPKAAEAVDLFVYKICEAIGRLAVTLGGIDALVFTGGIGENSSEIRRRIIKKLAWLNIEIDDEKNRSQSIEIHKEQSLADVLVLKTDEEKIIAANTLNKIKLKAEV